MEALDDDELEARLYPSVVAAAARPEPDCAWIHRERRRAGVTLELLHLEYLEQHPDGFRYTSFCERYREWLGRRGLVMRQVHVAGEKIFVDYSGKKPRIVDADDGRGDRGRALRRGARRVELHVRRGDADAARPGLDREPRARLRVLRRRARGAACPTS